MSPIATVLIPTFDHGPLLTFALKSALHQTVRDIEVFVVGDGVPDATRKIVTEHQNKDNRIIFFDNPKGEGNGEAYRHAALQTALGRLVFYLADDDLWLPNHIQLLADRLKNCDFAASWGAFLSPEKPVTDADFVLFDLAHPYFLDYLRTKDNLVPLSCVAHKRTAYTDLPEGWSPAPKKQSSDLHMWRKFLAREGLRTGMVYEITCLYFPSKLRRKAEFDDRYTELGQMWRAIYEQPDMGGIPAELRALLSKLLSHYAAASKTGIVSRTDAGNAIEQAYKLRRGRHANLLSRF